MSSLTIVEVLLQVIHDLCGVTDDVVIMDKDWHLTSGVKVHEPGLIVFAEG